MQKPYKEKAPKPKLAPAKRNVELDPEVWGPHYWFFIHSVAMTYPNFPNSVSKKKFYDFFQMLPLFIPVEDMAAKFSKLLDEFPVQPYLDNRESLLKWTWYIHNKVNTSLEKPILPFDKFYSTLHEQFKSKPEQVSDFFFLKKKLVYIGSLGIIATAIYYLYDK
jgi:hypothetical protein